MIMKPEHRHALISDLNRLLVQSGGSLLEEQSFKTTISAETSKGVATTLALAVEIAEIALRWAADVKQKVNTLASPIYSIPAELLQTTIESALDKEYTDNYYQDLQLLRSVSARWCQTIDNSPKLWTHINTKMPAATVQMTAQRSQSLPLAIDCNEEPAKDWLAIVISYQERWESLRVQSLLVGTMTYILSASSPKLTSIILSGPIEGNLGHSVENFLSKSPNIRNLQITGWGFYWDASFATEIRSLTLEEIDDNDTPTLKNVIDMLSCCPKLAKLRIKNLYFHQPEPATHHVADHPAHLPSLQNLFLDFYSTTLITQNDLAIPHSAQITIDGANAYDGDWVFQSFIQWMERASIGWNCSDSIAIEQHEEDCYTTSYGEGHFQISDLTMDFEEFARFLSWLDVNKREAITTVEYDQLVFIDNGYDYVDGLDQLFPSTTHFTFGAISPFELKKIFRSISTPQADEDDADEEKWLFQELRHLTVRGPVPAALLISFASARIAAADALEVARLVDIRASGLKSTDAERSRLEQLVTIIDS